MLAFLPVVAIVGLVTPVAGRVFERRGKEGLMGKWKESELRCVGSTPIIAAKLPNDPRFDAEGHGETYVPDSQEAWHPYSLADGHWPAIHVRACLCGCQS